MARKLGDVAIVLVIMLFLVSAFSIALLGMDDAAGITTGINDDLSYIKGNISRTNPDVVAGFSNQMDDPGEGLLPPDTGDVDTRGSSAAGILNTNSKNVFKAFLDVTGEKLHVPGIVMGLLYSLIGVIITIMFLRFIVSEGKI